ncbi:MAG: class F sortase [Dehalococcoidia bacterium]
MGAPADAPVRLVVPSIGVDANIETFNLNPDLSMPVPETGDVAAWYTFGGGAGGPGNAVLAGHVDLNYHRAVFYELGNVAEGDNVWLQDAGGAWFQYRVIWTVSLVDDSAPIDQIAGYTDIPSLTLITCSGGFDRTIGRYVERRIVRAELVAPADQAAP